MTRNNTLPAVLAALLLAGASAVHAQAPTPPADAGKGPAKGRAEARDCSKAADPKACEERRAKLRSDMQAAHKACEGKQGTERRDCMSKAMCAKSADPAKCEARAADRAKQRADKMKAREAKREERRKQAPAAAPTTAPAPDAKKP